VLKAVAAFVRNNTRLLLQPPQHYYYNYDTYDNYTTAALLTAVDSDVRYAIQPTTTNSGVNDIR